MISSPGGATLKLAQGWILLCAVKSSADLESLLDQPRLFIPPPLRTCGATSPLYRPAGAPPFWDATHPSRLAASPLPLPVGATLAPPNRSLRIQGHLAIAPPLPSQ